jgi:hypothetical protein
MPELDGLHCDETYKTLVQYPPPEEIPYPLRRAFNATCVSSEVFDLKPTLGDQNPKFQIPIKTQAPIPNEQEFGANRRFHTDAQWFFFGF